LPDLSFRQGQRENNRFPTTARLMMFKLVIAASKTWRRLKGTNQLPKVIAGVRFNGGIEVIQMPANHAA
jgi:putative transposase